MNLALYPLDNQSTGIDKAALSVKDLLRMFPFSKKVL
jgi:hypothetical protein